MLAHYPLHPLEVQIGRWKDDWNCGRQDLGLRNEDEPALEQNASEVVSESEGI